MKEFKSADDLRLGMKVRVKRDLEKRGYDGNSVTASMMDLRGQEFTIIDNPNLKNGCKLDCKIYVNWTYDMLELVEYTNFTMNDLETGMIVKSDNGYYYLVMKLANEFIFLNKNTSSYFNRPITDQSLDSYPTFGVNIIEVYRTNNHNGFKSNFESRHMELIWSLDDTKEMTLEEIERELGHKVKIIEEDK